MASRNPQDMHPEMTRRWLLAQAAFVAEYPPPHAQPFLTATFRDNDEQEILYAQGRTTGGKIVTHARGGQSLHNHRLAFDVAFRTANDAVDWSPELFAKFAAIAEPLGLAWGGRWRKPDRPHFEVPGYTYRDALAGKSPVFPDLPAAPGAQLPAPGQHPEP